jgi:hypothetical protein
MKLFRMIIKLNLTLYTTDWDITINIYCKCPKG